MLGKGGVALDLQGNECSRKRYAPIYKLRKENNNNMAHYYQKRWVFTWNSDEKRYFIEYFKLIRFLNEISKEGGFQKERGETTGRLHYQGRFELKGTRTGKK